ncbi:MAG: hypothetical protein IKE76_12005 [Clostridia bacterium]|nr:hypothetical protein [Clostridia bacterium]
MAITNLFRGGMPDFKGWFCDGQFAEFTPPFDAPHAKFTPPFDSHADAAHGQGYLNLHFPLVPNLNDTVGHRWMQYGLKGLKAQGDVILTNWVPLRSYVDSVYYEANLFDKNLDGVYVKPVAYRVAWDFTNEEWTYTKIDAFTSQLSAAGIDKFPLGTPGGSDKIYGMARLVGASGTSQLTSGATTGTVTGTVDGTSVTGTSAGSVTNTSGTASTMADMPVTFGHNIPELDENGKPVGGYDDWFGAVCLGYEVSNGSADKIKNIWKSTFALYMSAKLFTFEGSTQIG